MVCDDALGCTHSACVSVAHAPSSCPCADPCPLKTAMGLVGGKWKVPILGALRANGPTR